MPALVNSRFGASGMSEAEGTIECFLDSKKSRKDWRISLEVMVFWEPRMDANKREFFYLGSSMIRSHSSLERLKFKIRPTVSCVIFR